jgi:hypothetical protein
MAMRRGQHRKVPPRRRSPKIRPWPHKHHEARRHTAASDAIRSATLQLPRHAEAADSHVLLTAYTAGTTPVNPHWSWVSTYANDVMLDWLFSHRLSTRNSAADATATARLTPVS